MILWNLGFVPFIYFFIASIPVATHVLTLERNFVLVRLQFSVGIGTQSKINGRDVHLHHEILISVALPVLK